MLAPLLGFRKLLDIARGILEREQTAAVGQRDRIVKAALPAARCGQRYRSVAWLLGLLI
jgi:hypothetical protein